MTAIAFSAGLALGVVVGAALWSAAQLIARKLYESARRRELAEVRKQFVERHKAIDEAKQKLRMEYGAEMTQEQERVMETELGKLYKSFPNPQVPKRAT